MQLQGLTSLKSAGKTSKLEIQGINAAVLGSSPLLEWELRNQGLALSPQYLQHCVQCLTGSRSSIHAG